MKRVLKDGRALELEAESRPRNGEDWLLICHLSQHMAKSPRRAARKRINVFRQRYLYKRLMSSRSTTGWVGVLKLGSLVMLRGGSNEDEA